MHIFRGTLNIDLIDMDHMLYKKQLTDQHPLNIPISYTEARLELSQNKVLSDPKQR